MSSEVLYKIISGTPDAVCRQCSQFFEGGCRAYFVPHLEEERRARTTEYGKECDTLFVRKIRQRHIGEKYRT